MEKICDVIMLPTDKAENCIVISAAKDWYFKGYFTQEYLQSQDKKSYHPYFTIDRDEKDKSTWIKDGDWYIDDANRIRKAITSDKNYWDSRKHYKKIIATTDKLGIGYNEDSIDYDPRSKTGGQIYIPTPNESFIEEFIKSNGTIKKVAVEFNEVMDNDELIKDNPKTHFIPKTRPDNTIIITNFFT